jgi:hypothetical protein
MLNIIFASFGLTAVVAAAYGVNAIISPALLLLQAKFLLSYLTGCAVASSLLANTIDFISSRVNGNRNLKKIANYLSDGKVNIDSRSLKNAEVISTEEQKNVTTPEGIEQEKTENNDIIMRTLKGKVVVARETINTVRSGKKLKLVKENTTFRLLNDEEAKQVKDSNPALTQKVLTRRTR